LATVTFIFTPWRIVAVVGIALLAVYLATKEIQWFVERDMDDRRVVEWMFAAVVTALATIVAFLALGISILEGVRP
jgi:hypothetical protein